MTTDRKPKKPEPKAPKPTPSERRPLPDVPMPIAGVALVCTCCGNPKSGGVACVVCGN